MEKHIAIAGAYSTGKTTLFHQLEKELPGYYPVAEAARAHIKQLGIPVDSMTNSEKQELQRHQLWYSMRAHYKAAKYNQPILMDTGIIEAYAYGFDVLPRKDLSMMEDLISAFAEFYHVLLLPPCIPLENDGERHTDPTYRIAIHHRINSVLDAHKIQYDTVLSMGKESRKEEAMSYITNKPWHATE